MGDFFCRDDSLQNLDIWGGKPVADPTLSEGRAPGGHMTGDTSPDAWGSALPAGATTCAAPANRVSQTRSPASRPGLGPPLRATGSSDATRTSGVPDIRKADGGLPPTASDLAE